MGSASVSVPVGLDYAAVLAFGAALEVDEELLADVLPAAEAAILACLSGDGGEDSTDHSE